MERFDFLNQVVTSESSQEEPEQTPDIRKIYRGIWANYLVDGQELPVGGSVFSKELTTKLELDVSAFDDQIQNFTQENITQAYKQSEHSVREWLQKLGSDIVIPFTFFLCYQVQQKMHKLLDVDGDIPTDPSERGKMYWEKKMAKLSELKGKTECAERAALGQFLLQRVGAESAYVSGITMHDVKNSEELPENHSFIVLKHPTKSDSTLIFDIARPHAQKDVPKVLETDVPFRYELFENKKELFIGATELLRGERLWFGVGDQVFGDHKTIEK